MIMKHFHHYLLFLFSLLFFFQNAQAQINREVFITGDYNGVSFRDFVKDIEAKTPYRFFYDAAQADSLSITLHVQDKKINVVLQEALANTDFHFAVDNQNHVYVVKGREIQASLPDDFFDRGVVKEKQYSKALLDYVDDAKKEKTKALAESKLYEIGKKTNTIGTGNAVIAGHIRSFESGESIIGASIYIEKPSLVGVVSDQFGYFAITLPKGRHELNVKSVGMKNTKRQVMLYSDGKLDIEIQEDVTPLKEVVVEAEKDKNVSGMQMGLDRLDIKTMKTIPVAFGEVDVMKVMLTLPGVQSVGEGSSGFNVRGGSTNQNLILLNDATVYNPNHLFGFFSAFNADAVKNVELYKSGIPAEYGGRLSSVMDVNMREGNKKKFGGSGGIGPITGRLTLEGPIIKDKSSFLIGGRSTYSDWLLSKIPNDAIKHSKASFYDVNAIITHEINEKNTIYATGYISNDAFTLNGDTTYSYNNKTATVKWKHIFGEKLYGVLTGAYSGYDYTIKRSKVPLDAFKMTYGIEQTNVKADFSYFPIPKHSVNFGLTSIKYSLNAGSYLPLGPDSGVVPDVLQKEHALESAAYISDNIDITPKLSLYFGLRYSFYNYLGPRDVYQYAPDIPRTPDTITDTVSYSAGKHITNYSGPEYRFSAKYAIGDNASVKFSYNRMRQYIQMLSNTVAISPTDIWKLSDPNIKPQIGDQIALGFYKNLRSNTIETSIEGYYKIMQNSIDYKGGATLLLNHHIETDIVNARGKAYGVEVMIKKLSGKLNGWISYTYSRSLLQTNSIYASETINNGNYYPSNYDKPHAVNFIGNYKFSHRFSTSVNITYSTGRPITLPIAQYASGGTVRLLYEERNQSRIPDYFRIDLSLNIEGNHKIRKLAHSSWTVGVYNLLGRKNPYSVYFQSSDKGIQGRMLSIFGSPIPTITYNFKF